MPSLLYVAGSKQASSSLSYYRQLLNEVDNSEDIVGRELQEDLVAA
jgi:hypothetical protein